MRRFRVVAPAWYVSPSPSSSPSLSTSLSHRRSPKSRRSPRTIWMRPPRQRQGVVTRPEHRPFEEQAAANNVKGAGVVLYSRMNHAQCRKTKSRRKRAGMLCARTRRRANKWCSLPVIRLFIVASVPCMRRCVGSHRFMFGLRIGAGTQGTSLGGSQYMNAEVAKRQPREWSFRGQRGCDGNIRRGARVSQMNSRRRGGSSEGRRDETKSCDAMRCKAMK